MITRSSIAFEDFLGSSIAPQVMPPWVQQDVTVADMEFVINFTPSDFQAKNFTPSILPNFNSFSDKNTKK